MKNSLFIDFSLLKTNANFRATFIARIISLMGLGMLAVALPMQVYEMTKDTFHVGMVMALDGIGMFVGLLYGGVLADRYDRKKLILLGRSICGLGFIGLAVNAELAEPSLSVIYFLALWDGLFGALGVTALLACMPHIVGRENLMQARAISMSSMRLVSIAAPAFGGVIIANYGVSCNYLIATIGTLLTLIPLFSLPSMKPKLASQQHPLKELGDGFRFVLKHKVVGGVVLMGTLVTLTTAIRVLFPAMVESDFNGGSVELGLMYSAVPLGATIGVLLSGWATNLVKPGQVMGFISLGVFSTLIVLGFSTSLWFTLAVLVLFGYLVSITSLLQYTLVQGHTPDHYLGRINGIWTAQDACGDSVGTASIGVLGQFIKPLACIVVFGGVSLALGMTVIGITKKLRTAQFNDPNIEPS